MKKVVFAFALLCATLAAFTQNLGDANNSGTIDIVDALVVAQYYVGLNPQNFYASAADVNSSGVIDIVDALLVAQYYVGLITEFPGQTQTPVGTATATPVSTPTATPAGTPTSTPQAGNLLSNPGFETGTTEGWYSFGESASLAISTVKVHTGTYSGLSSNRVEDWNGPGLDLLGIMSAGKTYELSIWVTMDNAASATLKATVKKVDGNGEGYAPLESATVTGSAWTQLGGFYTFEPTGTVTELVLYVEGGAVGASYFADDAYVAETSSEWLAEANARIEQLRKRDVTISLKDTSGAAIQSATIELRQLRREFGFGSAFAEAMKANAMYAEWFKNNYEWATFENEMKWYHNEPSQGNLAYDDSDPMLQFCMDNDIKVHGHCVFWEVEKYVQDWVKNLSSSALQTAMQSRIDSVVGRYKGKLPHWDVNNEMLHGSYYKDRLGESIWTWMYQQVNKVDPACLLFVNDYNVVEQGETNLYVEQIRKLIDSGAPIHGIGAQCHFGNSAITPAAILSRLDKLAQFGLPIWVTEFDVVEPDVAKRAEKLEIFYRVAFSHPAVDGIIMWGFWAGQHWKGADAAIVDQDWTVNAAGLRYQSLMKEWKTNASGNATSGSYSFRGFAGKYEATITLPNGYWEVQTIDVPSGSGTLNVTISMNTTATPAPTPRPTPESVGLKVQYKAGDTNATAGSMKPHFKVINVGSQTFDYQNIKIRYWYTKEGYTDEQFNFDYVKMGSTNIAGTFGTGYLEVSFGSSAGTIAPGQDSGDIQTRINKTDWTTYTQTNDYSFDATKTAYTEWDRVTLYYNGTIVWGVEPE